MNKTEALILDSIFFEVPAFSILKGAWLKIIPGRVTSVTGRNGAGKSTLLKIAAGQIQATGGVTILDGLRIHKKAVKKRFKKIGYLPQTSMLPPEISVNRLIKSLPSSEKLLDDPFISKIWHQKIRELSGGEKRYLEIRLIFHLERKYILLDEPFTGVEPYICELIIEMIKQEAERGKGILLTDHLHRYILQAADEGYLLHHKQCYYLGEDISRELKSLGYL